MADIIETLDLPQPLHEAIWGLVREHTVTEQFAAASIDDALAQGRLVLTDMVMLRLPRPRERA